MRTQSAPGKASVRCDCEQTSARETHHWASNGWRAMDILDTCNAVAMSSLEGVLTILLIFTAFGLMLGGPRGARWVLRTAFAPVRAILERRVTGVLQVCGLAIGAYLIGWWLRGQ